MNIDDQLKLGHLFFTERKCRSCGKQKNLIEEFYRTRKGSGVSSYSYECKECTIKRVIVSRMQTTIFDRWEYPDW